MGVAIPVTSLNEYRKIFGSPADPTWDLFLDDNHLAPDACNGYFKVSSGKGILLITRIELDGSAKKSKLILKNRDGLDVLKIEAANEGRWGGKGIEIPASPIVFATPSTFTLHAPGTLSNEYADAEVEFESAPGKRYKIVANTAANETSGEVVFTVGSQYNLLLDGISGPSLISGSASYQRYLSLGGTIQYQLYRDLQGTIDINNNILTGTATAFLDELEVGDTVYLGGEGRVVESISSNSAATISEPFSSGNASNQTLQTDNRNIIGINTSFLSDFSAGDNVYVEIDGTRYNRTIAEVTSDTELSLVSGFPYPFSGSTYQIEQLVVVGTGTEFTTEVAIGDYLIDPSRQGEALRVTEISDDTHLEVEKPFANNFSGAELSKQSKKARVELAQIGTEGLSVKVGAGLRYPSTHFSLQVFFNGSLVLEVPDASLDPADDYFVNDVVAEASNNVAYHQAGENILTWISAESLWNSAYTTHQDSDVRPINGAGLALAVTETRLYTVADFNYSRAIGHELYLKPYTEYRNRVRIRNSEAPTAIEGQGTSIGNVVYGINSNFIGDLNFGDYLYSPHTNEVRRIVRIVSDDELILDRAFTDNITEPTSLKKAGFLEVSLGSNLQVGIEEGDLFRVSYPEYLQGGYDGDIANTIPYYWTQYLDTDTNHLENAVYGLNLGLVRIAAPGKTDISINKEGAAYAEARSFEFRQELPVWLQSAASAEAYMNQQLGRSDFVSVAFPSYGYIANPSGAGKRLISLSGHIMGGESRFAQDNGGYHVIFAGRRAILSGVVSLPYEVPSSDEAIANTAGLQMIKFNRGNINVWGARCPALTSAYIFLHVRRIQSDYNRIFLEAENLQELMFRPNQPEIAEEFEMILRNFVRNEYKKGVFTKHLSQEQAVQILTNNTAGYGQNGDNVSGQESSDRIVELINGILSASIDFTPTGVIESLTLTIRPSILTDNFAAASSARI
jgi:hypothetical protein